MVIRKLAQKMLLLSLFLLFQSKVSLCDQRSKDPEVFFSPDRNNEKIVSEYIKEAKKSVEVAAYSLTNKVIGSSIKETRAKGVRVDVLCDKQQAQISSALCVNVNGKTDIKSGLMHHKFIVRDEKCVLTGSLNFTNNAIFNNRENFIIICDEKVAEAYHKEFQKLWQNNT